MVQASVCYALLSFVTALWHTFTAPGDTMRRYTLPDAGLVGGFVWLAFFWWLAVAGGVPFTALGWAALVIATALYALGVACRALRKPKASANAFGVASLLSLGAIIGGAWGGG